MKTIRRTIGVILMMGLLSMLMGCIKKGGDVEVDIGGGITGAGAKAVANESAITGFTYSYMNSMMEGSFTYTVKEENGTYQFIYESADHRAYEPMEMELDASVAEKLKQLYIDHKVYTWDGYHKTDSDVMDGDGFSLEISFADGQQMTAYGSNCEPSGYGAYVAALKDLFADQEKSLLEAGRQQIIAQGVSGNLNSFMVCMKQQGASGKDQYDIMVCEQGIRDKNFDVRVQEGADGFFGGNRQYYMELPNEAIDFEGVKALIEKYQVMNWYGWEEADPDYNNCEWFQISFSFEEGNIGAYGTAKPENYEKFRAEFLTLMAEMVENAKANYGLVEYK